MLPARYITEAYPLIPGQHLTHTPKHRTDRHSIRPIRKQRTYTMASNESILQRGNVLGPTEESQRKILTPQALAFLALLQRSFNDTRKALLERRKLRQAELDKGALPDFLPETKHIRDDPTWKGAAPAPGLVDRRVEITGPTDRK